MRVVLLVIAFSGVGLSLNDTETRGHLVLPGRGMAGVLIGYQPGLTRQRSCLLAAIGLILLAIGAVLRYAVTAEASGVDLDMIGLILMTTGAVGFLLGLFDGTFRKKRVERHVSTDGRHVIEETESSGI